MRQDPAAADHQRAQVLHYSTLLDCTDCPGSLQASLWPATLEYLCLPDYEGAVPAVARSLAHLAALPAHTGSQLDWGQFQVSNFPH